MAVSIFDENAPQDGTIFTPFDESKAGKIRNAAYQSTLSSEQGINTKEIDAFRQGIELTTQAHRFKGLGAKIWAGNTEGYTRIDTFGQALRFTEYEGTIAWEELSEFDPVAYLELGAFYPYPIVFNEGPQQNKEASLQPFAIPFRDGISDDIDGPEKPHAIRGSLEDGNQNINFLNGRTSRIEQLIPYESSIEQEPFLDEGQEYFGETRSGSIILEGYVWEDEKKILPFVENNANPLVSSLNTNNVDLITLLTSVSMSVNLEDDIRDGYDVASATAGYLTYGPNQARYNTDSVAYVGTYKGS